MANLLHKYKYWLLVFTILASLFVFKLPGLSSWLLSKKLNYPINIENISLKPKFKLELQNIKLGQQRSLIYLSDLSLSQIKLTKPQSVQVVFKNFSLNKVLKIAHCKGQFLLNAEKVNDITKLKLSEIELHLDEARLAGESQININPKSKRVEVLVNGSITKGSLKQILSCLDISFDDINANVEVPTFDLAMVIENGIFLEDSLRGTGSFNFENGRFKALDIVKPIFNKLLPYKKTQDLNKDTKSFSRISSNFEIKDTKINLQNIELKNPYTKAHGYGSIAFDGSLDIKLLLGDLGNYLMIDKLKLDYLLPQGLIPLRISGTGESPLVIPDILSITDIAKPRLLDRIFDFFKKL